MLYMINKNYYIKVGRKFINVDISYENNDINLKPNRKKYIEDNGKIKYEMIKIDDNFKNKFKPKETPSYNLRNS